jgi:hypothetical protein
MGFHALLNSGQPLAVLWPLLRTWTQAASRYPAGSDARLFWEDAMEALGLWGAGFAERLVALDAYLDSAEETLEAWARSNGAWEA